MKYVFKIKHFLPRNLVACTALIYIVISNDSTLIYTVLRTI